MSMTALYAGIAAILEEDAALLELLGIDEDTPQDVRAVRLQQRFAPRSLLPENLPVLTFYLLPGKMQQDLYTVPVAFDVYTDGDVALGLRIADRIQALFHGKLPQMAGVATHESVLRNANEKTSAAPDTYGFTVVVSFSLNLES